MYFKTKNGPVRVSPLAMQKSIVTEKYGDGGTPFYKSPYYWVAVIAVIILIIVIVYCMRKKSKSY